MVLVLHGLMEMEAVKTLFNRKWATSGFLAEQVLAGETYAGKFFLLTKDLDMGADKGLKFDPIGMYDDYIDTSNPNQGEDQGIIEASKCFRECLTEMAKDR